MPRSQLTMAIRTARQAGFSFTYPSNTSGNQRPCNRNPTKPPKSQTKPPPKNCSVHATSAPIFNSKRFKDRSYYPPPGQLLPDDWVHAPVRFHSRRDNVTHYYRAGSGGKGWEAMHYKQYMEQEQKILRQFEHSGGLARVNWNLDDHPYWSKPSIEKKNILITRTQWIDWIKEQWRERQERIEEERKREMLAEEGSSVKAEQAEGVKGPTDQGKVDGALKVAKGMEGQTKTLYMPDGERRRRLGKQMRLRSYHQEIIEQLHIMRGADISP